MLHPVRALIQQHLGKQKIRCFCCNDRTDVFVVRFEGRWDLCCLECFEVFNASQEQFAYHYDWVRQYPVGSMSVGLGSGDVRADPGV